MLARRLRVPARLTAVVLTGALAASCNGDKSSDAADVTDTTLADSASDGFDAPPDCYEPCFNEYYPSADGALLHVVIYPDGAQSYDAECNTPPPDPRCGV